jgi:hypothetical protein
MNVRERVFLQIKHGDDTIENRDPVIDELKEWVGIAARDTNAAKVLRLLGGYPHDWINLYKVFEIVEKEVGEDIVHNWITRKKAKLFTRAANSVGAIGDDCRHGTEQTEPPQNPMSIVEARDLIKIILNYWKATKR